MEKLSLRSKVDICFILVLIFTFTLASLWGTKDNARAQQSETKKNTIIKLTPDDPAWLKTGPKVEESDPENGKSLEKIGERLSQNAVKHFENTNPIKIVYPVVMPPYTFKDDAGVAQGLAIDLLRLWSKKFGAPIQFTSAPWNEGLQMMREGKADVHASLYYTEDRDTYMDYAAVVASSAGDIFSHKSILPLGSSADLRAYRVGAVRGSYHEEYIRKNLPEGILVSYPEWPEMVMAARKGDIRVFVEDVGATLYRLKERGLADEFRYNPGNPLYRNNFWIAVREGDLGLVKAIKQGMALITPEERSAIERKWLGTSSTKTSNTLTIAIQSDFTPFSFINAEGEPAGLFVDIWQRWAKKAGKKIVFRPSDWNETLKSLKTGDADIHSGLFYSDSRAKWFDYSLPFYEAGSCFFYFHNQKPYNETEDLTGKKVGVVRGSYQEEYLGKHYPTVNIISFPSIEKMVRSIVKGETFAFMSEYLSSLAIINRLGLVGKIHPSDKILFTRKFHPGILKGNRDILSIVEKGFKTITDYELAEIEKYWVPESEKQYFRKDDKGIDLTVSEKTWLVAHPDIQIGYTDTFEPEVIVNPDGSIRGILVDILERLNRRMGTRIRLRIYPIPELVEKAQKKRLPAS